MMRFSLLVVAVSNLFAILPYNFRLLVRPSGSSSEFYLLLPAQNLFRTFHDYTGDVPYNPLSLYTLSIQFVAPFFALPASVPVMVVLLIMRMPNPEILEVPS